jgi:uncharacterized caspase-like protein
LDKEATSEKVLAGVSSLMKQAQPGDTVLLYLSSHGVRPPKGADATRGGSALYFAMSNTVLDEKKFYSSSLACDDLLKVINDNVNEAVHVLLVLDTCYSGKLADAATYNEAISNLREHVYVMTSCDVNEESLEDNTVWKHGLFTGALLEGLSSMAQPYRMQGKDGSLTLFDLEFYVKRRVHDRIETDANLFGGHKQNPMLYGPGDRYFPLFKVR